MLEKFLRSRSPDKESAPKLEGAKFEKNDFNREKYKHLAQEEIKGLRKKIEGRSLAPKTLRRLILGASLSFSLAAGFSERAAYAEEVVPVQNHEMHKITKELAASKKAINDLDKLSLDKPGFNPVYRYSHNNEQEAGVIESGGKREDMIQGTVLVKGYSAYLDSELTQHGIDNDEHIAKGKFVIAQAPESLKVKSTGSHREAVGYGRTETEALGSALYEAASTEMVRVEGMTGNAEEEKQSPKEHLSDSVAYDAAVLSVDVLLKNVQITKENKVSIGSMKELYEVHITADGAEEIN